MGVLRLARAIASRTFWRIDQVRSIRRGPAKGLRYRIFTGYGLAPLVGRYEPDLQAALTSLIRPGDVVYDVGANHGIHSLLMARLVGTEGKVFGFEPNPSVSRRAEENLQLNGFDNARLFQLAVGETNGTVRLWVGRGSAEATIDKAMALPGSVSVEVTATTLDSFVSTSGEPPILVKIDVEGSESAVLRGSSKTMAEHRPVLLIELHSPEQDVEVGRLLQQHDYAASRIDGTEIKTMDRGWPDPDGIWGQIVARPTRTGGGLARIP
jgi:FkbM family methyltransferase